MSKIRIKNFGPIQEGYQEDDGFMDIKKVTVFIGNQGSGKSTVAKLISTFTWIEKALVRGDYNTKWFERKKKFKNQYLTYHRIENYINDLRDIDTVIEYKGDAYHIKYENGVLKINETKNGSYPLPQIMYVPAERNFIANVKTPKALKLTSDSLVEFVTEFDNAKNEIRGTMQLPINNVEVEYNKPNDFVYIKSNKYKINLTEASSGFQSLVPLYLVTWFLANSIKRQTENSKPQSSDELERFKKGVATIWADETLSDEQRRAALSALATKFNKSAFINIVEEAEQNLFPSSQRQMLNSLVAFANMNTGNKLIMTTHSPYIINYLTLSVKANLLLGMINDSSKKEVLTKKINKIVPLESTVEPQNLVIYELNDEGEIIKLGDDNNNQLPSDENYLNELLGETNELFAQLLEIQQEL